MLWETSQQLTNLPPISPETRRLIAEFLNVDQDINALASELSEDFFDVVQRLTDPAVKAWINAINALKNNERRERALHSLDLALTNEHNPNHIRRAATRILRHFELTRPPRTTRAIEVVGSVETEKIDARPPTTSMRPPSDSKSSTSTLNQSDDDPTNTPCHRLPKTIGAEPPSCVNHSQFPSLNANVSSHTGPRQTIEVPPAPCTSQSQAVSTSPANPVFTPATPLPTLSCSLIAPENTNKTPPHRIDYNPALANSHPSAIVLSGFDPATQPTVTQANIPSEEKRCFESRHPPWSHFMGLDFAIDALYQTDFKAQDVVDCKVHKDGRAYPTVQAVGEWFERAGGGTGYSLTIRHVQLFDCYRAEWRDANGDACGAVVGQTAEEAAVYALSLLRRQLQGV